MKKFFFFCLLAATAGCIQVDYTGKKFAPAGTVTHYTSLEEFHSKENQDDYLLIGRFTATGGIKKHPFDFALWKGKKEEGEKVSGGYVG